MSKYQDIKDDIRKIPKGMRNAYVLGQIKSAAEIAGIVSGGYEDFWSKTYQLTQALDEVEQESNQHIDIKKETTK